MSEIPAIDSFRGVGEVICESYSVSQRQRFYDACKLTMEGYRTAQQLRVGGRIPTWEEYSKYREGSFELAIESNIPEDVMRCEVRRCDIFRRRLCLSHGL